MSSSYHLSYARDQGRDDNVSYDLPYNVQILNFDGIMRRDIDDDLIAVSMYRKCQWVPPNARLAQAPT